MLSDTHFRSDRARRIPPETYGRVASEGADLVLHVGDVLEAEQLELFAARVAPVRAVRGNHDRHPSVAHLPESLELALGGVRVAMLHDAGRARGRSERLRGRFPDARVIVFGHSHVPQAEVDGGVLLLNPGDAGRTYAVVRVGDDGSVRAGLLRNAGGPRWARLLLSVRLGAAGCAPCPAAPMPLT